MIHTTRIAAVLVDHASLYSTVGKYASEWSVGVTPRYHLFGFARRPVFILHNFGIQ